MIKLTPAFIFLIGFLAFPVFAQLDRAPVLSKNMEVEYPESALAEGKRGAVITRLTISKWGKVTNVEFISASDARFVEPALAAARKMKFLPAIKGGKSVEAIVRQPVVFIPRGKDEKDYAVMPLYHSDPQKAGLKGAAFLNLKVNKKGHVYKVEVLRSSGLIFTEAAVKSAKELKFDPATRSGINVYSEVRMPFVFVVTHNPNADRPLSVLKRCSPSYTDESPPTGFDGKVTVQIASDENGRVTAVKLVSASHSYFVKSALVAAQRMEFKPAIKNGRVIASVMQQRFTFSATLF